METILTDLSMTAYAEIHANVTKT